MSTAINSGDFVQFADGAGKVINIIGLTSDLNKGADGSPLAPLARVRCYNHGQPTDAIKFLPVDQLTPAQTAIPQLAKNATLDDLSEMSKNLTEAERTAVAVAMFHETGPRLPTTIIGEEYQRSPISGVDRPADLQ